MPAFTTNVEFGYYIHTGKITYGRPEKAPKTKYLDWLYELDYDKNLFDNLKDLIDYTVKLVDEIYDDKQQEVLPVSKRKIVIKR